MRPVIEMVKCLRRVPPMRNQPVLGKAAPGWIRTCQAHRKKWRGETVWPLSKWRSKCLQDSVPVKPGAVLTYPS